MTISPQAALFDSIYERLVLLLAGSSLELSTSSLLATEGPSPASKRPPTPGPIQEGLIMGVVASRRARGDRIELWVGGKQKKEPTPGDWIDRLKEVLADQLEMPEVSKAPLLFLDFSVLREKAEFSTDNVRRSCSITATDEQVQEALLDDAVVIRSEGIVRGNGFAREKRGSFFFPGTTGKRPRTTNNEPTGSLASFPMPLLDYSGNARGSVLFSIAKNPCYFRILRT